MLNVDIVMRRGGFELKAAFAVASAGVTALFGPSGCGKTSVIQCIAGLLEPDAGRIDFDSTCFHDSSRGLHLNAEKRGVGCVFQDARLFPHLSVRANLGYGERRSNRPAIATFGQVVDLLNLHALLDRRPSHLSGGERQRVAIGRALLSRPRLLLLDEPLASLDAARRDEVLPYLEQLRDRLAIPMIYVSHQYDEILRLATSLVLMREGSVVAQGTVSELSHSPQLRPLVGSDLTGTVIDARAMALDDSGLMRVGVGSGELRLPAGGCIVGQALRLHLLARDVIIATGPWTASSIRNCIAGTIAGIEHEAPASDLISIDVGAGQRLMARVTPAATKALGLHLGQSVWAMIKAAALQGHSFAAPATRHEL